MAHQNTNPDQNQITNPDVEEFMESPLITWFSNCLEDIITHKLTFDELVDGVLIYNVFLKMDIHGQINDVSAPNGNHTQRLKNLQVIMSNMRLFYEEDSIVLQEPELRLIARAAHSNVREIELLLVLLLGCAVKCPNKKNFIERITRLDKVTQEAIASQIGRVTHFPDVVLCRDMLLVETTDLDDEIEPEEQTFHTQKVYRAFEEVRRIYKERVELIEREESALPLSVPHCMLELNEWKSKALQLKNIEEEYMQELQKYAERLEIVEKENSRLVTEAKAAKEYRDELDVVNEKALQAERLEQECARYKEKLEQHESCRSRLEELKRDNQLLQENKEELVGQLDIYKVKVEKMMKIEEQMYKLKEQCDKFVLENNAFQTKIAELSAVNEELECKIQHTKSTPGSPSSILTAAVSNESLNVSFDNSICEQMSRSTNCQALKLELENRRLSTMVESLRESSFHNSSFKILDLEKEKKRLELENEDLQSRLSQFEENLSTAAKEKQQLRSLLENLQKVGNNGEMVSRIVALESEKRKALRELERTQASLDASAKIIKDLQIKLQASEKQRNQESDSEDDDLNSSILKSPPKSQNRLELDLDNVTHERNVLKLQVRDAQTKLKRQTEIVEQLESTVKKLQAPGSPNALKTEFVKLKQDFITLMSEYRKAKSVADELTKRQDENQVEMRAKNARIIKLDIYLSKLQHKCLMLSQLTERAETDKRALMDYVAQILKHNHELVTQTLEDKEHYREEERRNNETVNHLSRAKEKLEEKIMDQFRKMDNSKKRDVKKRSAAVSVVKSTFGKVRRAGSELFSRSRKSWSDESNSPTEKSDDFEFTRPSDVGTHVNVPRNRKSIDFMDDFEPENFSFDQRNNNF